MQECSRRSHSKTQPQNPRPAQSGQGPFCSNEDAWTSFVTSVVRRFCSFPSRHWFNLVARQSLLSRERETATRLDCISASVTPSPHTRPQDSVSHISP